MVVNIVLDSMGPKQYEVKKKSLYYQQFSAQAQNIVPYQLLCPKLTSWTKPAQCAC